jgi:proline iminopeptidase
VFYDPRARGRSEASDRSLVTIDRQVADLESLRASLSIDSMTLIGWSGLGMEMFVYAMRHPDRVRQLVQVAPVAARDAPHNARAYATRLANTDTAALRMLRERRAGGEFATDPAGHCRALNAVTMPVNFADRSYADSIPDTCRFPNEYPDSLGPLFDALLGSFRGYDWRDSAQALPVGRLVIHGAEDAFPLEGSQEWVAPGSNARLLVIDGAGHFPFVERPEVFFPAIESFLRGNWPPGATVPP